MQKAAVSRWQISDDKESCKCKPCGLIFFFFKKDKVSDIDVPVKYKTVKVESLFVCFYWKARLVLPGLTVMYNMPQEAANEFQDQTKGLDSMD